MTGIKEVDALLAVEPRPEIRKEQNKEIIAFLKELKAQKKTATDPIQQAAIQTGIAHLEHRKNYIKELIAAENPPQLPPDANAPTVGSEDAPFDGATLEQAGVPSEHTGGVYVAPPTDAQMQAMENAGKAGAAITSVIKNISMTDVPCVSLDAAIENLCYRLVTSDTMVDMAVYVGQIKILCEAKQAYDGGAVGAIFEQFKGLLKQ